MPVNVTDVDTFTEVVQAPADGAAADEAEFKLGHQHNANRTRYFRNRGLGLKVDFQYHVPLVAQYTIEFNPVIATTNMGYTQVDTINPSLSIPLPAMDPLLKINGVSARYRAAATHGGLLPEAQPTVALYRQAAGVAVAVLVASAQDTAGTAVDYEAAAGRQIDLEAADLGGSGHAFVAENSYYVLFYGESGANSMVGLKLVGIKLLIGPVA